MLVKYCMYFDVCSSTYSWIIASNCHIKCIHQHAGYIQPPSVPPPFRFVGGKKLIKSEKNTAKCEQIILISVYASKFATQSNTVGTVDFCIAKPVYGIWHICIWCHIQGLRHGNWIHKESHAHKQIDETVAILEMRM